MGKRLVVNGADFSEVSIDSPNIASPVFTPTQGQYQNSVSVSISCRTSGVTIYYTTDGTTPTTSSSVYSSPIVLNTIGATTVKAMCVKGGVSSEVVSATYTVVEQIIIPESVTIQGAQESTSKEVQLTASVSPSGAPNTIVWSVISGNATVSSSGLVTFDDSTSLSGDVTVRATVSGYQNVYAEHTIHYNVPLSPPTISPSSGSIDGEPITVTITAASGASIYYTLDGSTPTNQSNLYSSPLTISSATTVKAMCVKGGVSSEVVSATYTQPKWKDGYYAFTDGAYHGNPSGGRAYVCTTMPITIGDYSNLMLHLKDGWKVRVFFTNSSTPPLSSPSNTTLTADGEDLDQSVASLNTYNKTYMWINLCNKNTNSTATFTVITDEELALINADGVCTWGEQVTT